MAEPPSLFPSQYLAVAEFTDLRATGGKLLDGRRTGLIASQTVAAHDDGAERAVAEIRLRLRKDLVEQWSRYPAWNSQSFALRIVRHDRVPIGSEYEDAAVCRRLCFDKLSSLIQRIVCDIAYNMWLEIAFEIGNLADHQHRQNAAGECIIQRMLGFRDRGDADTNDGEGEYAIGILVVVVNDVQVGEDKEGDEEAYDSQNTGNSITRPGQRGAGGGDSDQDAGSEQVVKDTILDGDVPQHPREPLIRRGP